MRRLLLLPILLACASAPSDPAPTPDAGTTPDPCLARCTQFASCSAFDTAACTSACTGATPACLVPATDCAAAEACVPRPLVDGSWVEAPASATPGTLAADTVLPTTAGETRLSTLWAGGNVVAVLVYDARDSLSSAVWNLAFHDLLRRSPRNVHYVFAARRRDGPDESASQVETPRTHAEEALARLPADDAAHWRAHLHFVTRAAEDLGGLVSTIFAARGVRAFGIDRFQHLREVGYLANLGQTTQPKLDFLANEAIYWNFEWSREEQLRARPALRVPIVNEREIGAEETFDVTLPDASLLAAFDTLEVELTLDCRGHLDGACGEWDYLAYLQLCDAATPETCDVELLRVITPYHRAGRWVTNMDALLPLLRDGGPRRIRFSAPQQPNDAVYVVSAALRFVRGEWPVGPYVSEPAFTGGPFDAAYNDTREPLRFTPPDDATSIELHVLVTGHGFGDDTENCAEFCNHTHHFTLNGTELVIRHPEAGSSRGCLDRIDVGVVPNQYGTWPFGRGGWCPGLDVKPHVLDLTPAVIRGAENVLTYRGLLDGRPYTPRRVSNPSNFPGRIDMTSRLVYRK